MYDFGENIFMNNEKYLDELDGRLQVLNELRKRIIELSKAIIGDWENRNLRLQWHCF